MQEIRKEFEIVFADTEELKRKCFKIRHQVYCKEQGFLDNLEQTIETDKYDARSEHFLIKWRGEFVATSRLIMTDTKNPLAPFLLKRLV